MSAELQSQLLQILDKDGSISNTSDLKIEGLDQLDVFSALKSLESKQMVEFAAIDKELWMLTAEGSEIVKLGSHEARVFDSVPEGSEGITIADLAAKLGPSAKIGQGKAFQNKWVAKKGDRLVRLVSSITDTTKTDLQLIQQNGIHEKNDVLKDLKRRKLCDKTKILSYSVKKGLNFSTTVVKQATDLTAEMIQSGSWKTEKFKEYNFEAAGLPTKGGYLHPLLKVREEFQQIFFDMGFEEMPTYNYVESSFWNFDALYIPQQHPARDLQDTFFIKDPVKATELPDFYKTVQKVHESGGYGSIGYRHKWSYEEAQKLVLRTHTTAVTGFMLHKLAKEFKPFKPLKMFSIDRVFRNESVDATHLAEFHQVEGIIADKDINLASLISFMDTFFGKMGIKNLQFKPTYNPYTEPSMEIFSWHEGFGKWVEIGNSGLFRPELLRSLGVDPGVRVIGFGLSLERPTMIKYGINNIRSLVGHKIDLNMVEKNPICRLEKDSSSRAFEHTFIED
ncbi:Phenylalanine-tRNA ligase alpha subunit [Smittium culicis]|uniref:Probable phenylalanine--tRNA ligase alpha subunit n=1 Tax=Smittium culicis TaxID=133412 RepID=A0A1R1Y4P5_9FUNG|nr:Phenylalanine-tRNA ligase alpha subunit [Smittium culicis]